ncbi:MAG: tRNA (adenosine(37)-N6)-threonylcarbamoyltransferase complex transferase subunit TsaD [Lentisphaeria bacterium]
MRILGIETSCDETAVAIVEDGIDVKTSVVSSQVDLHADYGGVVPELAARQHLKNISTVTDKALRNAKLDITEIEAVGVTANPGLIPALLVGVSYAQGIAAGSGIPVVGVNHFLGHIYSCFIENPELLEDQQLFPLIALVVSGGHTVICRIDSNGTAQILGQTLDDAAGEAFDKAAKILELGYPGGAVIDRLAADGNPGSVEFPRGLTGGSGKPVKAENRFNFSFSGLKTSLLYKVKESWPEGKRLNDILAGYQAAIVDVLTRKTLDAAATCNAPTILMCGGVACNKALRRNMHDKAEEQGRKVYMASPKYCTDNAAMIAGLAYYYIRYSRADHPGVVVNARLGTDLGILPFTPEAPHRGY